MTIANRFYVTTPIYYVNDKPHIGHAYTSLACDTLARFYRLKGKEVYFLTGTDEHGQKVEKAAESKGIDPQTFTDQVSKQFCDLAERMDFSNDDFIRTTDERHQKGAQAFWKRLEKNGAIYKGKYAGWYAMRDEAYYQEAELLDGKAPTGAEVEWVEEESYFFRLSDYTDKLLEYYESHPDFIFPESRRNEVLAFVKGGLRDLSISRTTFSWGVPVPGDDKHVMYVWLDALTNYITALGFPDENDERYASFWPASMHVVGKDILRFHAVYWPAFLMAADLPIPKQIIAHGWWTNQGQKISKSLGNVIDPLELLDQFGRDAVRYFLMREVPFGSDGNYTPKRLVERYNSELANMVGNLSQRSLSMIFKQCDGVVPAPTFLEEDQELLSLLYNEATLAEYDNAFEQLAFDKAMLLISRISTAADSYIDMQAPWTLRKEGDLERMGTVLYVVAETVRCLAILLMPFIPDGATALLDQLKIPQDQRNFLAITPHASLVAGTVIDKPEGVFPRLDSQD